MAVVPNRSPQHYGGVVLDRDGAVTGFVPRGPRAEGSFHFIGVQVVEARVFRGVPAGVVANSVGEVYKRTYCLADGEPAAENEKNELRDKNVVLSRRAILEEEQRALAAETRKNLSEGKVLKGKVTGATTFGAKEE